MCLLWRSPMTRSPESTSGDLIFNLAIAHSGKLEIGTRQLNNWRLRVPPDFLPFCQPGALPTRLHSSRMPRHHTRPPGRYKLKEDFKPLDNLTHLNDLKNLNLDFILTKSSYLKYFLGIKYPNQMCVNFSKEICSKYPKRDMYD